MADKFTFRSAGEIQDLEFALARNGWTHILLKKATGGDFFGLVREVAEGRAKICWIERSQNIYQIIIGGNRTIAEVVAGSGYTDYDRSILERCALVRGPEQNATIEIFSIEHFDHDPTDMEVEAEYVRRGLKRPIADHAVHFGDQKRDLPEEGHPIIFYLEDPVSDALGARDVLFLWRIGANRKLYCHWLYPSSRWNRFYRFAGVRE